MTLMACRKCGTKFAVGLPYCPQCTSTDCTEDRDVPKISKHGGASNSAADGPAGTAPATSGEVSSSPGSSSSTSSKKPASSRRKSAAGTRKPARTTDSPSKPDQTEGSSAPSTDGGPEDDTSATTAD